MQRSTQLPQSSLPFSGRLSYQPSQHRPPSYSELTCPWINQTPSHPAPWGSLTDTLPGALQLAGTSPCSMPHSPLQGTENPSISKARVRIPHALLLSFLSPTPDPPASVSHELGLQVHTTTTSLESAFCHRWEPGYPQLSYQLVEVKLRSVLLRHLLSPPKPVAQLTESQGTSPKHAQGIRSFTEQQLHYLFHLIGDRDTIQPT